VALLGCWGCGWAFGPGGLRALGERGNTCFSTACAGRFVQLSGPTADAAMHGCEVQEMTYIAGLTLAWAVGYIAGYQVRMVRKALVAAG